jgi:hypothetical protein
VTGVEASSVADASTATLIADALDRVRDRRDRPPRLVIHAGLPKTGTTAVQHALWAGRDRLLRDASTLYPASVISPERPRQQWLPSLLRQGDPARFGQRLAESLEEAPSARLLLLSGEGVSYHWHRIPPSGGAILTALGRLLDTRIVLVLRPRPRFALSMWKQAVVNPPTEPEFGRSWDLDTFLRHPHVRGLLDYPALVASMRERLRPGEVRLVPYRPGTAVSDVLRAAGIDLSLPEEPRGASTSNRSLSVRATELLRLANQEEPFDRVTRAAFVTLLRDLDADGTADLDEPELPPSVTDLASAGDAALEQEMGVPSGWLAGA